MAANIEFGVRVYIRYISMLPVMSPETTEISPWLRRNSPSMTIKKDSFLSSSVPNSPRSFVFLPPTPWGGGGRPENLTQQVRAVVFDQELNEFPVVLRAEKLVLTFFVSVTNLCGK